MSSAATGFGEGAKRRPALVRTLVILGAACGLWALIASCFAVDVTEYAVVTRFGRVLSVISAPGLYFKVPFDSVVRVDRRLLLARPAEAEFLSEDKKNIVVDTMLTWRIADPRRYLETLGERAVAEARITDIVEGEIGAVIGRFSASSFITAGAASSQYQLDGACDPRPCRALRRQGLRHRTGGCGHSSPVSAGTEQGARVRPYEGRAGQDRQGAAFGGRDGGEAHHRGSRSPAGRHRGGSVCQGAAVERTPASRFGKRTAATPAARPRKRSWPKAWRRPTTSTMPCDCRRADRPSRTPRWDERVHYSEILRLKG